MRRARSTDRFTLPRPVLAMRSNDDPFFAQRMPSLFPVMRGIHYLARICERADCRNLGPSYGQCHLLELALDWVENKAQGFQRSYPEKREVAFFAENNRRSAPAFSVDDISASDPSHELFAVCQDKRSRRVRLYSDRVEYFLRDESV